MLPVALFVGSGPLVVVYVHLGVSPLEAASRAAATGDSASIVASDEPQASCRRSCALSQPASRDRRADATVAPTELGSSCSQNRITVQPTCSSARVFRTSRSLFSLILGSSSRNCLRGSCRALGTRARNNHQ